MIENKIVLSVNINSIKGNGIDRNVFYLKKIFFELRRKEILAIIGPNGIGKTTLLNSFLNILDSNYAVDGSISLMGMDTMSSSEKVLINLRKNVTKYIFQDAANCFDPLRKLTYYFDSSIDKNELDFYLSYFLLPPCDNLLNKYPGELSVGMAQRLAIIWGLLSKPQLLLLDEPSSALDAPIINLLSHKLKEWSEVNNSSIVLVTQNIDFAIHTATHISLLTKDGLIHYSKNDIPNLQKNLCGSSTASKS